MFKTFPYNNCQKMLYIGPSPLFWCVCCLALFWSLQGCLLRDRFIALSLHRSAFYRSFRRTIIIPQDHTRKGEPKIWFLKFFMFRLTILNMSNLWWIFRMTIHFHFCILINKFIWNPQNICANYKIRIFRFTCVCFI